MSDTAPALPPARKARTRRLSCPGCGGSIEVRANGISISAICASCGRTIDVASDDLRIIADAQAATRTLTIPIGTRATLAGTPWEVVGYQARSNPAEGWTWDEYLLFNPYRGFRFLAHDDEGWTLFCMLRQDIPEPSHADGVRFEGPEASQARTDYVLGEFYWRVRVGDTAHVEQYQAGSSFLVKEVTGDEIVWSRGFKLPTDMVRSAFKLDPAPSPTAANSPRQKTVAVLWTGIAACVLLTLLSAISFGASRSTQVFRQAYRVSASDRSHPIASAPFTIPDRSGNLRLDLYAPVQNDWVSLNLSLVGEGGAPVFDAVRTIEYYTGTDSDGSWEEGSQNARVLFRSVPGGSYRLLVEFDAGKLDRSSGLTARLAASANNAPAPPGPTVAFTVEARRHVPAPEWFWIGLGLIVPYPVYRLLFKRGSR